MIVTKAWLSSKCKPDILSLMTALTIYNKSTNHKRNGNN